MTHGTVSHPSSDAPAVTDVLAPPPARPSWAASDGWFFGRSGGFLASVAVHGLVAWGLTTWGSQLGSLAAPAPTGTYVVARAESKPPPPPPPPPDPEPQPEPELRPATRAVPTQEQPAPPEAPPPGPPEPLDMTGLTLTASGTGGGFESVVGNGQASSGPIRAPRAAGVSTAAPAPAASQPVPVAAARGPAMVEAADLSERPQPPALNGVLRQHFPEEARRKGISGTAVVIARIDPDGTARSVRVASESSAGFGAACQATVMNSRWTPPRDRDHRPCATRVSYTCRFQVEQ